MLVAATPVGARLRQKNCCGGCELRCSRAFPFLLDISRGHTDIANKSWFKETCVPSLSLFPLFQTSLKEFYTSFHVSHVATLCRKYGKRAGNTDYKVYCLQCNLHREHGVVGEGDREREYGSDVSLRDLLKLWSPRSLFVFESPQKETPDAPSESRMKLKKGEGKKSSRCFPFSPLLPCAE